MFEKKRILILEEKILSISISSHIIHSFFNIYYYDGTKNINLFNKQIDKSKTELISMRTNLDYLQQKYVTDINFKGMIKLLNYRVSLTKNRTLTQNCVWKNIQEIIEIGGFSNLFTDFMSKLIYISDNFGYLKSEYLKPKSNNLSEIDLNNYFFQMNLKISELVNYVELFYIMMIYFDQEKICTFVPEEVQRKGLYLVSSK